MLRFGKTLFPVEGRYPQCKTDHEVFDGDFVDFKKPSPNRTFVIEVRNRKFYVDKELFSRNSDYFKIGMNCESFIEAEKGSIHIQDEKPRDILRLIKALSPNFLGLYQDEIRESTVSTILRLSDKYLISNLKDLCIEYLEEYNPKESRVEMLLTMVKFLATSDAIDKKSEDLFSQTILNCIMEVMRGKRRQELEFFNKQAKGTDTCMDKVLQAVTRRKFFTHRLAFFEEVQGLACHSCSRLASTRRRGFTLFLCSSCGQEICRDCSKKACEKLVHDWVIEMRS